MRLGREFAGERRGLARQFSSRCASSFRGVQARWGVRRDRLKVDSKIDAGVRRTPALRHSDGPSVNGHTEGTNRSLASLTCINALPEKWKVGGSTPPLPTAETPGQTLFGLGFCFTQTAGNGERVIRNRRVVPSMCPIGRTVPVSTRAPRTLTVTHETYRFHPRS